MRYFVQFSYLGTNYHGSQTQPNGITVQETMERVFSTILREPIALTFAGRTDAGVHAKKMVAHFDSSTPLLVDKVNSLLPSDIAVEKIWEVSDEMHARFSATSRTYEYRITTAKDPFLIHRATRVAVGLDFEAMNKAASYLIGTHDFASFCKVHTDVKTTFCTVTRAEWSNPTPLPPYSSTPIFRITADRFLRNMVRAVVGTLLEVGRHKMPPEAIGDVLAQRNRCAAGQSVPAEGLYLTKVEYPSEIFI